MSNIAEEFYEADEKQNLSKVEFAFRQGEKALETSIDISNVIEDKAYKLLGFLMSAFLVSLGAFFTIFFTPEANTHRISILVSLFILGLGLWYVVWHVKKCFALNDYFFLGNQPEKLLNKNLKNLSLYQLKVLEADNYQKYIKKNRQENDKKAKILKRSYDLINRVIYAALAVLVGIELVMLWW